MVKPVLKFINQLYHTLPLFVNPFMLYIGKHPGLKQTGILS